MSEKWEDRGDTIHFDVVSDGQSGEQCIEYFHLRGVRMGPGTTDILRSLYLKTTENVRTKITVIKGSSFERDELRHEANLNMKAGFLGLITPPMEIGCLIRKKFSGKEIAAMGLFRIIAMHVPIDGSMLAADWDDCLDADRDAKGRRLWVRGCGFAYANVHA